MARNLNPVARHVGCTGFRLSLLTTFAAMAAGIPTQRTGLRYGGQQSFLRYQTRPISDGPQDMRIPYEGHESNEEQAIKDNDSIRPSVPGALHLSPVPWYMKVEPLLKSPRPLSERQKIPELPEGSPPILQTLLQQLSVDLGLDDLSLLDLRNLKPPPALGANLMMIVGTARSEKHLHVSADRLCRWLRSEYKLRPDADGLLGRYELKLKMKRKNRRVQLLGNRAASDNVDDGVRTGWVCVNIGTVESSLYTGQATSERDGFVGFGRQTEGTNIVVQMLVEEKREELGLEDLWTGIAKQRSSPESDSEPASQTNLEPSSEYDFEKSSNSNMPNSARSNLNGNVGIFAQPLGQSRAFHTSPRMFSQTIDSVPQATITAATEPSISYGTGEDIIASLQELIMTLLESGACNAARNLVRENRKAIAELLNIPWTQFLLDQLKRYVTNASAEKALRDLGHGFDDFSSTPFLEAVYETISVFPSAAEWDFKIWLQCFARKIGHPGYTDEGLWTLFDQLRLSGTTVSLKTHLSVLRSILRPHGDGLNNSITGTGESQLQMVAGVLQDMHDRTGNVITEDVLVELQQCLADFHEPRACVSDQPLDTPDYIADASITYNLPVLKASGPHSRLNILMLSLNIPIMREDSQIRLLKTYAKQQDWTAFWMFFRSIEHHGGARSAAVYACMFQQVAESNQQKGCMTVLRTWIPEMKKEKWPIKLGGDVLLAVRMCLAVADREGEIDEANGRNIVGEWQELRQLCRDGIHRYPSGKKHNSTF